MRLTIAAFVVLVAAGQTTTENKLQGTWRLVTGVYGKHPLVPGVGPGNIKDTDIVIEGNQWVGSLPDGRKEKVAFRVGESTIDAEDSKEFDSALAALGLRTDVLKTPRPFDIKDVKGDDILGMYGVSGDDLVVRLSSGKERPGRFGIMDGDGVLLFYQRVRR